MSIMSDKWIKQMAESQNLIEPFFPESKSHNEDGTPVTSYGLSSFGYDIRLGNTFRLFDVKQRRTELSQTIYDVIHSQADIANVIDPVNFKPEITTAITIRDYESLLIPPNGFVLGVSRERIKLTRDFTAVCMEKSTLARCGLCVTVTPLEAGWEGYVTLEISNKTQLPIKLTPGMGICQVLFFRGNDSCAVSYGDRNGKYQGQPPEPVLPRRKE